MKEITFPVLVLDEECRKCDELNIVSEIKSRMYADEQCIGQEILVRCSDVYKCHRLQKRLKKEYTDGGKQSGKRGIE